jgi:hypothetical protein
MISYHHAQIEEKQLQKKQFQVQGSAFCSQEKSCKATYPDCIKRFQAQ